MASTAWYCACPARRGEVVYRMAFRVDATSVTWPGGQFDRRVVSVSFPASSALCFQNRGLARSITKHCKVYIPYNVSFPYVAYSFPFRHRPRVPSRRISDQICNIYFTETLSRREADHGTRKTVSD